MGSQGAGVTNDDAFARLKAAGIKPTSRMRNAITGTTGSVSTKLAAAEKVSSQVNKRRFATGVWQ